VVTKPLFYNASDEGGRIKNRLKKAS